jgi:thiosulfate reductase cytochrome b subunit
MQDLGKILVVLGVVLVGLGLLCMYGSQIPWLGKLPGDITIKRENVTFYFPLASSIVISILLTILFSLFRR